MFTFLDYAHMSLTSMFDVTEQVGLLWGGVGMFTFLEHAHMSLTSMFDVTEQVGLGWGGVGMFTFLEHAGQVRSGLHAKLASPFRAQAQKTSTLHGILFKIKSVCSMYSKIRRKICNVDPKRLDS